MSKPKLLTIEQLFDLYLCGYSLRNIERRTNISKSTLSMKFKKAFGDNYTSIRNNRGILPIIKHYLNNADLKPRDRDKIRHWLNNNLTNILKSDLAHRDTPLLTDKQEDKLTRAECGHKSRDWKELFEIINFTSQ